MLVRGPALEAEVHLPEMKRKDSHGCPTRAQSSAEWGTSLPGPSREIICLMVQDFGQSCWAGTGAGVQPPASSLSLSMPGRKHMEGWREARGGRAERAAVHSRGLTGPLALGPAGVGKVDAYSFPTVAPFGPVSGFCL